MIIDLFCGKKDEKIKEVESEYIYRQGFIIVGDDEKFKPYQTIKPKDIYPNETYDFIIVYKVLEYAKEQIRSLLVRPEDFIFSEGLTIYSVFMKCKKAYYEDRRYFDFVPAYEARIIDTVSDEIIFETTKDKYDMIETVDEFKEAKKIGSYDEFCRKKYMKLAIDLGYSEEFAKLTYKPSIKQMERLKDATKEGMPKNEIIMLLTGNEMPKVNITAEVKDDTHKSDEKPDMVNRPPHYTNRMHECIEEMRCVFGVDAVIAFCKCNAWKYRYRANSKGKHEEDMAKSDWYINKAMELQKEIMGGFM